MIKILNIIFNKLKSFYRNYEDSSKQKAVDVLEYELGEMENIFGLIILGAFIGLPAPPVQITLDLLPDMERHLIQMLNKVDTAESPFSELFSHLDIG